MRHDIVLVLKNSGLSFVRELVGKRLSIHKIICMFLIFEASVSELTMFILIWDFFLEYYIQFVWIIFNIKNVMLIHIVFEMS